MVELAKRMGLPAGVFAKLRQRDDVGHPLAQAGVIVGDAGLLRPQPGHHGTAAGIADRVLHIGAFERDAARPQAVQVRHLHEVSRERTAIVAQVIGHEEQDIGLGWLLGSARRRLGQHREQTEG
jgi:hypothetical protein